MSELDVERLAETLLRVHYVVGDHFESCPSSGRRPIFGPCDCSMRTVARSSAEAIAREYARLTEEADAPIASADTPR